MHYNDEWDALRKPPELNFYFVSRYDLNAVLETEYIACFANKEKAISFIERSQAGDFIYFISYVQTGGLKHTVKLHNIPSNIPGLAECFEAIEQRAREYKAQK